MKIHCVLTMLLMMVSVGNVHAFECKDHLLLGLPGESDQTLCRIGYAVGYNYEHQTPDWVAYKLTRNSVTTDAVKRQNWFRADNDIPKEFQANLNDYKGSGYDRGHLAPAASMDFSYAAMKESFLLTNIVPQKPGFNRYDLGKYGVWGALEDYVRKWAIRRGEVFVVTGPVYKETIDIIGDGIEVPSHYFKIIYDAEYKASIAFLIPHVENTAVRLPKYITSIDCIESLTGLDVLNAINDADENDIENGVAYDFQYWSMRDGDADEGSCSNKKLLVRE
ncbi:DNA/RNA non-specific endonuclease [Microbulbifer epialgicus]|uniref:Endonuclease n=1 Tax=Microbulbifer epialgicus TaxID=393907 RepID=A0ABV4NTK3_9GAMM